jgi:hypothetical protein
MKKPWSSLLFLLFITLPGIMFSAQGKAAGSFDKMGFYRDLSRNDLKLIEGQLQKVSLVKGADREAYEGTLLMKKASLVTDQQMKFSLFRTGRGKLDQVIQQFPETAEYRFLRLLIQENVPADFPYRSNISADAELIRAQFKSLSPDLKQVIRRYSKQSETLATL